MIAIIPARGGSKGIVGKNIKLLNGKPLIAYTIEAALNSKKIDRVVVSTDYEDIKEISVQYGAEVPFLRPDFLATDAASSLDVFQYTLHRLEQEEQIEFENFVVLQPTSPLRTTIHIDQAIALFEEKNAKAVVSYCKEQHSVFWHKFLDSDGKLVSIFNGNFVKNRQEMKPSFYPNGAIYVFDKKYIFNTKDFTENCYAYIMDREYSVDIDTMDDFLYAEFLLQQQNERKK